MNHVIGSSNARLIDLVKDRRELFHTNPEIFFPWRQPCVVKTLIVTDGILDFGQGDFGLSTFVDILLNDGRSYVRFDITLAHLRNNASDAQVMVGAPGITRSIKGFTFDNPSHFAPGMYDQVWMFGIETWFHQTSYSTRNNNRTQYPATALSDAELTNLSAHMNSGGGLFATGDHGYLGNALCGSVNRVRSMRYWGDHFVGGENEVSMAGPRRNDTNQVGDDPGSQFSDQSDDVPQRLDLKLYSTPVGFLREARYPHPLMCSRLGRIDVFPDHPHEGECRLPAGLTATYLDGSDEYPAALDGTGRVSPELIAHGRVPAGNTAVVDGQSTKTATEAHSFPVVAAYDGHRAGVGRVVTDSTWHHFVNVNLIGILEGGIFDDFPRYSGGTLVSGTPGTNPVKHDGFLGSPTGRAVLDRIKQYYVNVGVWISPPERQRCFNERIWWDVIWGDRIVEATLVDPHVPLHRLPLHALFPIGVHARDVVGQAFGACQTVHWLIDWLAPYYPEILPWIDPWRPWPRKTPEPMPPWFDIQPLIDIALGSALVSLRQAVPYPPDKFSKKVNTEIAEAIGRGTVDGLSRGLKRFAGDTRALGRLIGMGSRGLDGRLARTD